MGRPGGVLRSASLCYGAPVNSPRAAIELSRSSLRFASSARALATALILSWGGTVSAAPTDEDRAGARAAAYAGVEAFDAGRYQEAVDYFERAESIVHSPVHLSYIGRARLKLGQLVLAREAFLKVLREDASGDAARKARDTAAAELEGLEARIPSLTVQVTGAAGREFEVEVDGKRLPPALVGIPNPTDPGERRVVVTSGGASAEKTVELAEGAKEEVSLELPPPAESDDASTTTLSSESVSAADTGGISGLRLGSYIALGVGAAGLGAGTFFALRAGSKNDEATELCQRTTNTPSCAGLAPDDATALRVQDLDDEAKGARTFATIGFITGGVGVATGVTLFLLSLGNEEKAPGTARRVSPVLAHNYVGLTGTF